MNNYICNNCENEFELNSYDEEKCPSCKSENIKRIGKQDNGGDFLEKLKKWIQKNKKQLYIIIGFIIIGIFIFNINGCSTYEAQIIPYNDGSGNSQCAFEIIFGKNASNIDINDIIVDCPHGVRDNNYKRFIYHCPENYEGTSGEIKISLKNKKGMGCSSNKNSTTQIKIKNKTCFVFTGQCNVVADICNCNDLQIINIKTDLNYTKLTIHATLPDCKKEYSINGENGNYQEDSNFKIPNNTYEFNDIWVKTDRCNPKKYFDKLIIPKAQPTKPSVSSLTKNLEQLIDKQSVALMDQIWKKMFSNANVQITVLTGNGKMEIGIYDYLQGLITKAKSDGIQINVISIGLDSRNLINTAVFKEIKKNQSNS